MRQLAEESGERRIPGLKGGIVTCTEEAKELNQQSIFSRHAQTGARELFADMIDMHPASY